MQGHGCTRIDVILVNAVPLATFVKHEQIYGQGIAKHAMLSARFHLHSFGAKVTMPKTPSSMAQLERYELPEAVKEEPIYFALLPKVQERDPERLSQGLFTDAYDIWNQAIENHLALQLNKAKLPSTCKGKGKVPTFILQTLAAQRHAQH